MSTSGPARPGVLNTISPAAQARIALMRFGLGARRGLDASFFTTPNAAYDRCIAELDAPGAATINLIDMDPAGENVRLLLSAGEAHPLASGEPAFGINFSQERRARYAKHLIPRVGFVERLVLFWMNHFNMSASLGATMVTFLGLTERNVIRPHALGRFENMLLAVCQSPTMLTYLDGRNSTRLNTNQNFAREILELHTVGSSSDYSAERAVEASRNYTQADVESLAKILTGWGVKHNASDDRFLVPASLLAARRDDFRTFTFKPQLHAAGAQTVLGTSYADTGVEQGIAVLKDLAVHPYTAEHIARKMLSHFVTETPSEASVSTLANTFISTRGNLKEMGRALLNLEESWTVPLGRLRQPYPWFISMMRALGIPHLALTNLVAPTLNLTYQDFIDAPGSSYLNVLGQQPWGWRTPEGFPDRDAYWLNGDALRLRASTAYAFLNRLKDFPRGSGETMVTTREGVPDGSKIQSGTLLKRVPATRTFRWTYPPALQLATSLFGPTLSVETRRSIEQHAGTDNIAALTLLFTSPEFLFA